MSMHSRWLKAGLGSRHDSESSLARAPIYAPPLLDTRSSDAPTLAMCSSADDNIIVALGLGDLYVDMPQTEARPFIKSRIQQLEK